MMSNSRVGNLVLARRVEHACITYDPCGRTPIQIKRGLACLHSRQLSSLTNKAAPERKAANELRAGMMSNFSFCAPKTSGCMMSNSSYSSKGLLSKTP